MSKEFPLPTAQYNDWFTDIALGNIQGHTIRAEAGVNADIDIGDVPEDIWDFGGLYTFTDPTGADYFISSSSAADEQTLLVELLVIDNDDWVYEQVLTTLQGQTKTQVVPASGRTPVRMCTMTNISSTALAGDAYIYEDDTTTLGVPDTDSKIRGKIIIGAGKTRNAIFSTSSVSKSLLLSLTASLSGKNITELIVSIILKPFGRTELNFGDFSLASSGTGSFKTFATGGRLLPPKSDLLLRAVNVGANDTSAFGEIEMLLID